MSLTTLRLPLRPCARVASQGFAAPGSDFCSISCAGLASHSSTPLRHFTRPATGATTCVCGPRRVSETWHCAACGMVFCVHCRALRHAAGIGECRP